MENIRADFAQQFIDFIGICVDSDSLPLEMKQQLGNMTNEVLERQSENCPSRSGSQAASPSEFNVPPCTSNLNNEANKDAYSTVVVAAINNKPTVCEHLPSSGNPSRAGKKDASGHEPDVLPSPTPTVCANSEARSETVRNEDAKDESENSNLVAHASIESVNGSGATSPDSDADAHGATNQALLQLGQEQVRTACIPSSCDSVQSRLHRASSARSMEPELQATAFLGREPLGTVNAFAGPGMHVPAMQRATNETYFSPLVPSTVIDGQRAPEQNPFPCPNHLAGKGNSSQGHFHPMSIPPMAPMAYVGPFGYPAPGYEQMPFGSAGVAVASNVLTRVPLGNSRRPNVEAGEGSRASGAGPQRSGRKKATDTGRATVPNKPKPSLRCDLPGCPNPDKAFYSTRELRRHQTTTKAHSRISFPCPTCHKILSRDDARQRHIANVHNK